MNEIRFFWQTSAAELRQLLVNQDHLLSVAVQSGNAITILGSAAKGQFLFD